jgi:phosphopantothenoylcysteine decarboxylase/phosphopantothenate--cysteine ligase
MREGRPKLVVGFAAETEDVVRHATEKRARKGCDWIVANDVSPGTGSWAGRERGDADHIPGAEETWPRLSKQETARRLAARIAEAGLSGRRRVCVFGKDEGDRGAR